MTPLSEEAKARLSNVSTATLTTVLFKHGLKNTFLPGVHKINPDAPRMVGPAYTLRYIPAREDLDTLDVFQNWEHPQRKAVEECPAGAVMMIDSRRNANAASAGSILISRLMVKGAAGIVTDGGFRDTPELAALDFPTYHSQPSAPTNLCLHHAVDINQPIGCAEVPVYPGDTVVGDGEGVVVIPAHLTDAVAEEAAAMTDYEDFVTERVLAGQRIFGLYPASPESRAEFEAWLAKRGS
ncbi:MAG: ribonuclease activity regulator RraA [Alphaproteobacteria bacterium]|nr:ribonuclease activity regulator RraA [Alphaproteobacteria bacterium]